MKVLVLGGTGAIGSHLVNQLAKAGHSVTITSRQQRQGSDQVRYFQGDAKNTKVLKQILQEGWDSIVDFMVYSSSAFGASVDRFLDATDQYVFTSSARVYANSEGLIREDSPRLLDVSTDLKFLATDEYALSKARQEDLLFKSGSRNWTIVRPYITFGESRLQLGVMEKEEWLYRALQGRSIVFPADLLEKRTAMACGQDVSLGIAALLHNEQAMGEAFHITSKESIPWKDVLHSYVSVLQESFGISPKVKLVETETFLRCRPGRYQLLYDRMYDRVFDDAKISRIIDTSSFTKTKDGLAECLRRFCQAPQFGVINWANEARRDRETEEKARKTELDGLRSRLTYYWHRNFK